MPHLWLLRARGTDMLTGVLATRRVPHWRPADGSRGGGGGGRGRAGSAAAGMSLQASAPSLCALATQGLGAVVQVPTAATATEGGGFSPGNGLQLSSIAGACGGCIDDALPVLQLCVDRDPALLTTLGLAGDLWVLLDAALSNEAAHMTHATATAAAASASRSEAGLAVSYATWAADLYSGFDLGGVMVEATNASTGDGGPSAHVMRFHRPQSREVGSLGL